MKQYLSRFFALVLAVAICLVGCSSEPAGLTGDYRQDALSLINSLETTIELPENSADRAPAQADARDKISVFMSRYRRDSSVIDLKSFIDLRTALNTLASQYNDYPNRPLSDKIKARLNQGFSEVEFALERES